MTQRTSRIFSAESITPVVLTSLVTRLRTYPRPVSSTTSGHSALIRSFCGTQPAEYRPAWKTSTLAWRILRVFAVIVGRGGVGEQ